MKQTNKPQKKKSKKKIRNSLSALSFRSPCFDDEWIPFHSNYLLNHLCKLPLTKMRNESDLDRLTKITLEALPLSAIHMMVIYSRILFKGEFCSSFQLGELQSCTKAAVSHQTVRECKFAVKGL